MMANEEINALTDDQINKMVRDESDELLILTFVPDYCNDPAVMMPIVFESGISLIKVGSSNDGGYCAHCKKMTRTGDLDSLIVFQSSKPLRAAALAYLRKKGAL
ncbi:MAG: hypothetical protein ACRCYD_07020 [Plesiomonas sp.]